MQHAPRSVPRCCHTLFQQLSCKWYTRFVYLDSRTRTHLTLTLWILQSDLRAEIISQDTCTHAHLTGHRTQHWFQQCPHSDAVAFQWRARPGCSLTCSNTAWHMCSMSPSDQQEASGLPLKLHLYVRNQQPASVTLRLNVLNIEHNHQNGSRTLRSLHTPGRLQSNSKC